MIRIFLKGFDQMIERLKAIIRKAPDNYIVNLVISFLVNAFYRYTDKRKLLYGRNDRSNEILNTNNPLISVYLPTYNRCKILRDRAIPTVLSQTHKNFELVICDDGSTDDTEAVVKSFNDPRIKYIKISRDKYRYPNKSFYHWFSGSVTASNAALDKCNGAWSARIDDDCTWTNDHLEKLLDLAQKDDYEFVSSHLLVDLPGNKNITTHKDDIRNPTGIGSNLTWFYRGYLNEFKYSIHSWRKLYDRPNDADFRYRIYKSGVRIGYLNEVTASISPRPGDSGVGSEAYLADTEKYEDFYGSKS